MAPGAQTGHGKREATRIEKAEDTEGGGSALAYIGGPG